MKKTIVTVPWEQGLHTRPATLLVKMARRYKSSIRIKTREKVADARSILSVLLLCASAGTVLEIEVAGDDEAIAATAFERLFEMDGVRDGGAMDIYQMPERDGQS